MVKDSVNVFGLNYLKEHDEFTMSMWTKQFAKRDAFPKSQYGCIWLTLTYERPHFRFPEDWPGWIRDEHGDIFIVRLSRATRGRPRVLDFSTTSVQDIIPGSTSDSRIQVWLYDGVMSDYWTRGIGSSQSWDRNVATVWRALEEERREIIVQRI